MDSNIIEYLSSDDEDTVHIGIELLREGYTTDERDSYLAAGGLERLGNSGAWMKKYVESPNRFLGGAEYFISDQFTITDYATWAKTH